MGPEVQNHISDTLKLRVLHNSPALPGNRENKQRGPEQEQAQEQENRVFRSNPATTDEPTDYYYVRSARFETSPRRSGSVTGQPADDPIFRSPPNQTRRPSFW
ncbi:predicted protein [Coccidioides posadasii str. Silveira]|uniref:Predicted protein n=2 Tax=Coccidioides posadasii TaxID=199306 RepID=E9CSV9_COCPS|nr:predicted protein [Coccidioides posadasii str. Silveira]